MDKQTQFHRDFIGRLCDAAEPNLGISRHDRGFKRELARTLGVRDSTVQRWFQDSIPASDHLQKIYDKFGASPNYLLGINEATAPYQSLDLHRIQCVAGLKSKNVPEELLDEKHYSVGPIVRYTRSAFEPNRMDEKDIDSWGILRNDMVQNRKSIYGVVVSDEIAMSMWPIIKPGDLVIIDSRDQEIVDGGIYAINLGHEKYTIRQVKKANNSLILIPWFLREYSVEMIKLDEHPNCIVGKVVFALTYLTTKALDLERANLDKRVGQPQQRGPNPQL
jgi:transcriptional regulator with XRE-family HTH domain